MTTPGTRSLTRFPRCKFREYSVNQEIFSESFVENPKFPERALAASVASKVFYHLEEYDEALRLALESGDKFDLNEKNKYVETLINKCIDRYIKLRQEIVDGNNQQQAID